MRGFSAAPMKKSYIKLPLMRCVVCVNTAWKYVAKLTAKPAIMLTVMYSPKCSMICVRR